MQDIVNRSFERRLLSALHLAVTVNQRYFLKAILQVQRRRRSGTREVVNNSCSRGLSDGQVPERNGALEAMDLVPTASLDT